MLLEVRNLSKKFGDTEVLKGVDAELNRGEVLAVIGSSGSGKTTFLRCLNFLETADAGKILLDGKVLFDGGIGKRPGAEEIRRKRLNFGMVFQSFNLFPHCDALKNVALAPTLYGVEKFAEERKRGNVGKKYKNAKEKIASDIENEAKELLERVGLGDKFHAYPCELSGGQQQRVAIARALIMKPKILCFDEPTSALDPELTGEVLRVIKTLRESRTTMIVVTHEMEFARSVADKAMFMSDGIAEETGTAEEIFGNPRKEKTKNFLRRGKF